MGGLTNTNNRTPSDRCCNTPTELAHQHLRGIFDFIVGMQLLDVVVNYFFPVWFGKKKQWRAEGE